MRVTNPYSNYDLGVMLTGLLLSEGKADFLDLAERDLRFKYLEDDIRKGVFTSGEMADYVHFSSQSESFQATLHNSIMDSDVGFRLASAMINIYITDGLTSGGITAESSPLPLLGNVRMHNMAFQKCGGMDLWTRQQLESVEPHDKTHFNRRLKNLLEGISNGGFVEAITATTSDTLSTPSQGNTALAINATIQTAFGLLDLKPTSSLGAAFPVETVASLSSKTLPDGSLAYPNLHCTRGGELLPGLRVFPVDAQQLPAEDSDGKNLIIFDADSMLLDRGKTYFSKSESANLELSDSPDGTNPTINIFQTDAVALKAVRTFALSQIRNGVVLITGVNW